MVCVFAPLDVLLLAGGGHDHHFGLHSHCSRSQVFNDLESKLLIKRKYIQKKGQDGERNVLTGLEREEMDYGWIDQENFWLVATTITSMPREVWTSCLVSSLMALEGFDGIQPLLIVLGGSVLVFDIFHTWRSRLTALPLLCILLQQRVNFLLSNRYTLQPFTVN